MDNDKKQITALKFTKNNQVFRKNVLQKCDITTGTNEANEQAFTNKHFQFYKHQPKRQK